MTDAGDRAAPPLPPHLVRLQSVRNQTPGGVLLTMTQHKTKTSAHPAKSVWAPGYFRTAINRFLDTGAIIAPRRSGFLPETLEAAADQAIRAEPWRQLYDYWLSKHVDGQPPSRKDIDPIIDIPGVVKNLIIVAGLPDQFVYRLIGTEVVEHQGADLTGKRLGSSGAAAGAIAVWRAAIDHVARWQTPKLLAARFPALAVARNVILFLPLVDKDGQTRQILIGSFYDGYFPPGTLLGEMSAEEIDLSV